jgi:hypothetical protein
MQTNRGNSHHTLAYGTRNTPPCNRLRFLLWRKYRHAMTLRQLSEYILRRFQLPRATLPRYPAQIKLPQSVFWFFSGISPDLGFLVFSPLCCYFELAEILNLVPRIIACRWRRVAPKSSGKHSIPSRQALTISLGYVRREDILWAVANALE